MADFYHVCFAVPDLDAAMTDLHTATGMTWAQPQRGTLGEWDYRIVFSHSAPYVELIQGPAGSPWDTGGTARFDHLGWWTHSLTASSRRLADEGFPLEFDGCPHGRAFAYHRVESIGARIEVVDVAVQAAFLQTWDPGAVPPRALDC